MYGEVRENLGSAGIDARSLRLGGSLAHEAVGDPSEMVLLGPAGYVACGPAHGGT